LTIAKADNLKENNRNISYHLISILFTSYYVAVKIGKRQQGIGNRE